MFKLPPVVAVVGFYLLTYTDGCGRTNTTPAPPVVNSTSYVNTTIPENHRLVCTENEAQTTACLNEGICQATILDDYRVISCACPRRYVGKRCQMKDATIIFDLGDEDRVLKAGLAGGILAVMLFLTVLILIIIWCRRIAGKSVEEQKMLQKENP